MARERWWIEGGGDGERRRQLDARGLTSVAGTMAIAAGGEILSTDRNSAAVRLGGAVPLLIKWRRPRPGRARRTLLRASRERREARALMKARAIDIPAPTVWAVGERRRGGLLLGSCLIRPWVEDAVTASSLLLDAEGAAIARALAATLRRWHDAGFRHGDCYPKNVLVEPRTGIAAPIGCPAALFVRAGSQGDRMRWKDLAQWMVGLELLHASAAAKTLLEDYAAAGGGLGAASELGRRVAAARARILTKKAERLASRPVREPGGPPPPRALAAPAEGETSRRIQALERLVPRRR